MTFDEFCAEHGLSTQMTREPMTGATVYVDRATLFASLAWRAGAVEAVSRLPRRPGEIREGDMFHQLTVLADAGNSEAGKRLWRCRCSCGAVKVIQGTRLRAGQAKSCGHLYADRWGMTAEERDAK